MYFALVWTFVFVYSYVYICNPAATLKELIKKKKNIDLLLCKQTLHIRFTLHLSQQFWKKKKISIK